MTVPVCGLVFSRDRALQLDAVLRSYLNHVADSQSAELSVLYTTSSRRHTEQYADLIQTFAGTPGLRFIAEQDFRADVLRVLATGARLGPARQAALLRALGIGAGSLAARLARGLLTGVRDRHVLFLVDDNVFVRPFEMGAAAQLLEERPEALGFSLRLGRNVSYCYALDKPQAFPEVRAVAPGVLEFDWTKGDLDFGYPLELSSSLYRLAEVLPVLAKLRFANPNQMEARLAGRARRFKVRRPKLLCFGQSVTFCAPINRVQDEYANRAGDQEDQSAEALADLYASGSRIDVAAYEGFSPEACHQEVELHLCPAPPPRDRG